MSNPVEIVIQAVDRFSPVFAALDGALEAAEGAGARAEDATRTLSERLLALDSETAARRAAQREGQLAGEQEQVSTHHETLLAMETRFQHQLLALDQSVATARLETFQQFTASLQALAESHGGSLARAAKALAVAEALINAYLAGNKALASVPYPFNLAAAAAVTLQGLATVERIRQVNVAHGGLERVPEDATFLLQRGERVLSAPQNRDLARFLEEPQGVAGGRGVTIENLTIHVLEHATSAESLLTMERSALRQVVAERLIPMLDELARLGIRPHFVRENT